MLLEDLLRHKGDSVVTVTPTATVAELLDLLAEHNIGAVVVSGDGGSVEGIVSERDVVRQLRGRGAALLEATVSDIMTTQVRTAGPGDSVDALSGLMTANRIRHVPVVVDGRLHGILSIGDVVKTRLDELEDERKSLIGYINQGG